MNLKNKYIISIETSCDDTCIALVEIHTKKIINNQIYKQHSAHSPYQGIVPVVASIEHMKSLHVLFQKIMEENPEEIKNVKYIAVTNGPGLLGSLLIGINFAYGLCKWFNDNQASNIKDKNEKVNVLLTDHLEGHILVNKINYDIEYPFLALILSGGHSICMLWEKLGKYKILATTLDDAMGECLDKCGRFMNLPYPAGMYIEKEAENGENIVPLPIPMEQTRKKFLSNKNNNEDFISNFSFSGIKTAVYRIAITNKYSVTDICCSLQNVLIKSVINTIKDILKYHDVNQLVVGGGVMANKMFKESLNNLNLKLYAPKKEFATDSAIIPASVAIEYILNNREEELINKQPLVYSNLTYNKCFF